MSFDSLELYTGILEEFSTGYQATLSDLPTGYHIEHLGGGELWEAWRAKQPPAKLKAIQTKHNRKLTASGYWKSEAYKARRAQRRADAKRSASGTGV